MTPFVSIVLPIYKEEKFIEQCILSILSQDYSQDCMEVLFVDGMSPDRTRDIIKSYEATHPNFHLIDNPEKTVPYAMNKGITASKGDVIIRLDGHCVYPANYVSVLVKYLFELNADNVGGVWHTLPAKDTAECHAIAISSSHPFGVGASEHKIGSKEIKQTDTVPFGCFKREVFDRIGLFDEELIRNQDDEFNARIIKNGGKIFIIPEVEINYTSRDSTQKMRRMYFQYGLFKPLVNKKLGAPATIRQFFPGLFVIGLVLGLILSFVCRWIAWCYIGVLALYLLIGIGIGIQKAIKYKKTALVWYMPYTFFNIHLCYGIGYLVGLYKVIFNKKFCVHTNR